MGIYVFSVDFVRRVLASENHVTGLCWRCHNIAHQNDILVMCVCACMCVRQRIHRFGPLNSDCQRQIWRSLVFIMEYVRYESNGGEDLGAQLKYQGIFPKYWQCVSFRECGSGKGGSWGQTNPHRKGKISSRQFPGNSLPSEVRMDPEAARTFILQ